MKISDLLSISLRNLWRRKLRTFLTVLGVIIGAASIIIMLSLGLAIEKSQMDMIRGFGDLTSIKIHGSDSQRVMFSDESSSTSKTKAPPLNDATIKLLKQKQHVVDIFGLKSFQLQGQMTLGKYNLWGQIYGVDPRYFEVFDKPFVQGRNFSSGDRYALVVPEETKRMLYDEKTRKSATEDPNFDLMGEKLTFIIGWGTGHPDSSEKIKKIKGEIVGVVGGQGWEFYMPIEGVKKLEEEQKKIFPEGSISYGGSGNQQKKKADPYTRLDIKVDSYENVKALQEELKEEGYQTESMVDFSEGMKEGQATIQAVLGGIGSISLIVAAIGITNTMVMSIYERTREIGVMKVIGASVGNIRSIFLLEALLIGLSGGVLGVGLSLIISKVLNQLLGQGARVISIIPLWLMGAALGFSALIGLISGYYPAKRATKLSAIEAIKTE